MSRGISLASTIVLSAVLLVLVLTVASTATFHLQIASRQANLEQARNLAESVVALAIERLTAEPQFGLTGTPEERSLTAAFESAPFGEGRLTFDPARAAAWGIRLSVNNIEEDETAVGDGRMLPPFTAQLIGVGECNGVTSVVESVIRIPHYKYAIATSGTLSSTGGLYVASVDEFTDISGGFDTIPPEELLPGHIAANAVGVLDLSSSAPHPTVITGDARSGGTVSLGPYSSVRGAVLQDAEPAALPDLEVSDFDPEGWVGLYELPSSTFSSTLSLEGPVRHEGDVTVSNGGLELDNGYFFVEGDLVVNGGISGKGAVFCTGNITVSGASALSTDNVQALVAEGDITIVGYGKSASSFQGVMFNRGDVHISDITLVGSLVNNAPEGVDTEFEIERTNVVELPEAVSFEWNFPFASKTELIAPWGTPPGWPYEDDIHHLRVGDEVDLSAFYDPVTDSFDPSLATDDQIPLTYRIKVRDIYLGTYPEGYIETQDVNEAVHLIRMNSLIPEELEPDAVLAEITNTAIPAFRNQFRQNIADLDELYQATKDKRLKGGDFTLDPNQFLQFEDKVRVVWFSERHS